RLTSNVCIDFLRREKRLRPVHGAVSLDGDEAQGCYQLPDERYCPQRALERHELQRALRRCMETLTADHREVLVLRELGGLTYAEIEDVLGLEAGTVKSRIARARAALRRALLADGNFFSPLASIKTEKRREEVSRYDGL
ncbi:MAG: sigma-70 family RNA polymerase sigma factor, partial [Clostridiales bacterium]|nr:sigma-70 family RNA polymerase sigma factor [Clostridiales bacterium]